MVGSSSSDVCFQHDYGPNERCVCTVVRFCNPFDDAHYTQKVDRNWNKGHVLMNVVALILVKSNFSWITWMTRLSPDSRVLTASYSVISISKILLIEQ